MRLSWLSGTHGGPDSFVFSFLNVFGDAIAAIHIDEAANARERARMRVLSRAFCRLKTTLPWVPADTKLSKLDTLRLATTYIGHLRSVLIEGSSSGSTSPVPSHPLSVVSHTHSSIISFQAIISH